MLGTESVLIYVEQSRATADNVIISAHRRSGRATDTYLDSNNKM